MTHRLPHSALTASGVPGISVAVGDMVASLRRVAGDAVAGACRGGRPAIDRLVSSWPQAFAAGRGRALGMTADDDFDDIVRAYMAATAASRQ
jgi:hypothetical protein